MVKMLTALVSTISSSQRVDYFSAKILAYKIMPYLMIKVLTIR